MGRKSNTKDQLCIPDETNETDNNDLYRKRLRSWKPASTKLKSNHTINDEVTSLYRSTIYTYPINLNYDRQNTLSNTILSESLTTDSAFYCPSISCSSIQTTGDINNNHVTTSNLDDRKRKDNSLSCESLNDGNTNRSSSNNLQLTYYQNPIKRSQLTTDDSIITNHRSLNPPILIDDDTIDINQFDSHEQPLSSLNNESLINNSNSMETAVKMVQPIIDIIFNAFESQFKNIRPSLSNVSSISPQIYSPMMSPYFSSASPAHPIVLHAVNFNIQLTSKQPSTTQNLTNVTLIELKEKVVSYLLSNNFISHHHGKRRKLKHIIQLAVVGFSVLCGYFLL